MVTDLLVTMDTSHHSLVSFVTAAFTNKVVSGNQLQLSSQGNQILSTWQVGTIYMDCLKLTGVCFHLLDIDVDVKQCETVAPSLHLLLGVCLVVGHEENIICIEECPWY